MMTVKKGSILLVVGTLALLLAGCGNQKVTTTKSSYDADGLVAAVQAKTSAKAKVSYQVDNLASQKANNDSGTIVMQIPTSTKDQKVTITAKDGSDKSTKVVTVKAGKAIAEYPRVMTTYNGILAQQQQTTDLMPAVATNGLRDLVKTDFFTLRGNIQNDQLMGLALITPVKVLKNKTDVTKFGTTLAYVATAVGADGKQVVKDFSKKTKDNKDGQTTIDTIESNGVKFDVGLSTNKLYIYVTK